MFRFFKKKKSEPALKKKETRPVALSVDGFTDREISQIFNAGEIRKLNRGAYLFRQGEPDPSFYLVLSGSVKVVRNIGASAHKIAVLGRGQWVGEIAFIKNSIRTASIIAQEESSLLCIKTENMETLAPPLQLAIYRNLNKLTARRTNDLFDKSLFLLSRNRYLASYIQNSVIDDTDGYADSELIQGILNKIPRLPLYKSQLLAQLLDENASAKQLIEMAKTDSSLVSTILKTVNSAYYNLPRKIADFQHAVIFLGFNQVYQLVLETGVKSSMPDNEDFRALHAHSNIISLLCYEISLLAKRGTPVVISTAGLLHDIGKGVILLLKINNPKLGAVIDVLDHSRLGALLLKEWDIPETIHLVVELQIFAEFSPPETVPEACRQDVAILHIAHLCNEFLQNGNIDKYQGGFSSDYLAYLGLAEKKPLEFITKTIIPALRSKQHTYPEEIRQALTRIRR